MAIFECTVLYLEVKPHPNADVLELGKVGDYLSVIPKGKFKTGDKIVYIPEQAVLPDNIIKELGLEGKLAGSKKNRVKPIKLRDILSQGLIYPAQDSWVIGTDVKEILGITKYEQPIPIHLGGEVSSWEGKTKFDIENLKKYPSLFKEGEDVIFTEKIHGTCTVCSFIPKELSHLRKEDMIDGAWAISSKGLSDKSCYFKNVPQNQNNLYIKAFNEQYRRLVSEKFHDSKEIITLIGESFGKVQDLKYDVPNDVSFRLFGIKVGKSFLDFEEMERISKELEIPLVPVLYKGKFSKEVVENYTNGKEQVSGKESHIREGIVIYPKNERYSEEIGRVVLKSVSVDYLLRKGGSEFN